MKMKITVITPMLREFHCAREAFGAIEKEDRPYRYAVLSRKSREIRIVNCARDLKKVMDREVRESGAPDVLIDSGTAGGLSQSVKTGDLLAGERFLYKGLPVIEIDNRGFCICDAVRASVMTVDAPVETTAGRMEISGRADICTMESYHLASLAENLGCRFFSLRVVTDNADECTPVDFKKNSRKFCMNLYTMLKDTLQNISH